MGTQRIQKMCWRTIVHEPHILVRSRQYSLQQLWEAVLKGNMIFCTIEVFVPTDYLRESLPVFPTATVITIYPDKTKFAPPPPRSMTICLSHAA
ncbi:hypothetical protein TNCV_202081 [Trichonephila clavipes]|nr:hypothetical protein TNCV_202081 [Trichonephila clavipes]